MLATVKRLQLPAAAKEMRLNKTDHYTDHQEVQAATGKRQKG